MGPTWVLSAPDGHHVGHINLAIRDIFCISSHERNYSIIICRMGRHMLKSNTLRWRHNGCDSVSNRQPHDCLLNRLFRHRSKKTSKPRVTGLCAGNSPGTGEFPAQRASYAENVSIWWRHHEEDHKCRMHTKIASTKNIVNVQIQ